MLHNYDYLVDLFDIWVIGLVLRYSLSRDYNGKGKKIIQSLDDIVK